jgi:DNA repair ATPase RecN
MKVKIRNFQSLKDVQLDIKGLTTVTGTNNTGKSAITRALFNAFSSARGSNFVRNGENHCSVEIDIDSDNFVWEKGKKVNRYLVSGRKLDKVGSEVPTEISDLGIKPVMVDGREVWPQFAKQFDQLFLLNQPPSTLASALSDVETIDKLDNALDLARKESRELTSKLKSKREDLHSEKERLKSFDGLTEAEIVVTRLSVLQSNLDGLSSKIKKISDKSRLLSKLTEISEVLSESNVEIPDLKEVSRLDSGIVKSEALKRTLAKEKIREMMIEVGLDSYPLIEDDSIKNISRMEKKLSRLSKVSARHNRLKGIDDLPTIIDIPELGLLSDLEHKLKTSRTLSKLDLGIVQAHTQVNEIKESIEQIKASFGDNCPLCGKGVHE